MSLPSDEIVEYRSGQFVEMYILGIFRQMYPISAHLDVLPHVRLGVDDTHIWLVCASIHQDPIIKLQKRISGIVLAVSGIGCGTAPASADWSSRFSQTV
jgi:hypothetical protein